MRQHLANLPDRDLAYLEEGSAHFDDYLEAVGWAQDYARCNRAAMMARSSPRPGG
jgi:tRNA-splicing ligase RtcB